MGVPRGAAGGAAYPWDAGVGVGHLAGGGASIYLLALGLGTMAPLERSCVTQLRIGVLALLNAYYSLSLYFLNMDDQNCTWDSGPGFTGALHNNMNTSLCSGTII